MGVEDPVGGMPVVRKRPVSAPLERAITLGR
jgi:hypothetical protein